VNRAASTPLMQQYREIKSRHQDAILFFRMGDFYEMFYEDAEVASRTLGLTLTSRNNGGASETCIGNYWYQIYPGDWWSMSHGEPFLLRSYAGKEMSSDIISQF